MPLSRTPLPPWPNGRRATHCCDWLPSRALLDGGRRGAPGYPSQRAAGQPDKGGPWLGAPPKRALSRLLGGSFASLQPGHAGARRGRR
eukprot:7389311-Prymnesium_polylepis.1